MATPIPILARVKSFWATRTQNQRLMLGLGAALTAALLTLFTRLMMTPDYKQLMTGLEPADAQALSSELEAKKIPYQLSPDGKSLSVPADQLDAARMEVAAGPTTHSGRMGFELFDKVSWGQTDFDEKVNYQRALEGELERTIMTLGGIKSARVHLVMATDSVFIDRERSAKASVALKLSRGSLSRETTVAIQRLVAGAVDGLKPTDVSIIDADSNESLGTGDSAGGDGEEQALTRRLVATLSPIVGADHLRASVNVEYDQGTTEESQEKYDPAVSVPLTVQRSDEQTGAGSGVGGVPGTASNVPQPGAAANAASGKPTVQSTTVTDPSVSSKTENATYGVNKTTRHSIEPAGRIRRITAALVVDDFVQRKQGPKGKWVETRLKRSPEELKQLEDLATAAIGLDTARGDVISVQDMSFDHPESPEMPPPSMADKVRKGINDYATVVRYGMLLVLFLLGYLLMVRPVQQRALSGTKELAAGAQSRALPPPEEAELEPVPSAAIDAARVATLKQQVTQIVKAEPAASTRAIEAWIRGEGQ